MVKQSGVLDLGDGVGLARHAQDVGIVDLLGGGGNSKADFWLRHASSRHGFAATQSLTTADPASPTWVSSSNDSALCQRTPVVRFAPGAAGLGDAT
jgi:hypothetical protein